METSSIVTSSAVVASKPMNRGRIPWPGGPSKKQLWSLPDSIILYMAKNPSTAKCYQKMIQSCKYFFEKKPLLVIKRLYNCEDNVSFIVCSNTCKSCDKNYHECCVKVDIGKLTNKLWITDAIVIEEGNFMEMLRPKIYRSEADYLSLSGQVVTFDTFKFLVSSVKTLYLYCSTIEYEDGKSVMLEEILKFIPNIEWLDLTFKDGDSMVNASTLANIVKLDSLGNLKHFLLDGCPEAFAIPHLSAFFRKFPNMDIRLDFASNITVGYKNQLDLIVDELIASEVLDHFIMYEGQDEEKRKILENRYNHF